MPNLTATQAEAELIAHARAMEVHTVKVINAIVDGKLALHETDFDALAASVKAHNELIDGDILTALNEKIGAIKVTADTNTVALATLKTAVDSQIAALAKQIIDVQDEGRVARESLDDRITKNEQDISNSAAKAILVDAAQDQKLADHLTRIDALESWKVLLDARVIALEKDNTTNKSTIAQMLESISAQKTALEEEFARAKGIEDQLRSEIVTERKRTDDLATQAGTFVSRDELVVSSKAATNAGITAMYAEAGVALADADLIA